MSGTKIHDVAETTAMAERMLRDGTILRYQLTVLQQPMRARACGMGAKSHADRRPVDPPPVVELKIFSGDEKADVTFSHNSNFFLFATLEPARPIAQGRGMPAPAPAPVLTGVPVSGMAYLDRPKPAGYFIFPDLSVRHEGKYRLRFSLYEESKDRDEMSQPTREGEPREFAAHRVEVKSKPFTVYSAKKFPGLAESTALSRIVAEQGCRVRIRRDVRMRRRSERPGRDGDSEIDETAQLRAQRRGASPDGYDHDIRQGHHQPQQHPHSQPIPHSVQPGHHMQRSDSVDRKRSGSDASIASLPDVAVAPRYDDRYTPRHEHHQYGVAPPIPASQNHHLSFGSNANAHHPAPPSNVHTPQLYNPHSIHARYPTNPTAQHPHPSPNSAPAPRPQPLQNGQYGTTYHRDSSIAGHSQHNSVRRASTSQEYQAPVHSRRESESYRPPHYRPTTPSVPSQSAQYHGQMDNMAYNGPYQAPPQSQYHHQPAPPPSAPLALPFLKLPPLAIEPRIWESRNKVRSPSTAGPPPASALPSPAVYNPPTAPPQHHHQPQHPAQYSYTPQPQPYIPVSATPSKPVAKPVPVANEPPRGTKREWGRVFNDSHVAEPLYNGKRPDTVSENSGYGEDAEEEDDFDIGKLKMTYRRADGEEIVRRLPLEE
ncbi:velvet factor-domain-containing protein [Kalaharituber pfeilii]|nr:velvet factor-domain-containing protein [Kalaharituber pfeilii]